MPALRQFLRGSDPDAGADSPAAELAVLGAAGLVLGSIAAAGVIVARGTAPVTASLSAPPRQGATPVSTLPPRPPSTPGALPDWARVSASTSLAALRDEYGALWSRAAVRPERAAAADALARLLARSRGRYELAGAAYRVPWQVVAAIHSLEGGGSSGRFTGHLHNGDPLTARTVHVPAGRPASGRPPFTWEESASDALRRFERWSDWSLAGTLYQLEKYNGWGYRTRVDPPMPTPYLWSWTTAYVAGKYARDGVYDPALVSAQCGAAAILKSLEGLGLVPRYAV